MPETCETVKVRDENSPDGYVVINKEDFDKKTHKEWSESESKSSPRDSSKEK